MRQVSIEPLCCPVIVRRQILAVSLRLVSPLTTSWFAAAWRMPPPLSGFPSLRQFVLVVALNSTRISQWIAFWTAVVWALSLLMAWPFGRHSYGYVMLCRGALDFSRVHAATPADVAGWLGVAQWYSLLRRELLSCFDVIYSASRRRPLHRSVPISATAQREALVLGCLCAFWSVDLTLPFLGCVSATDASTSFGLGAVVAEADSQLVRRLFTQATVLGDYATL